MKRTLSIILAFALIASGCSTVNLIYRNADWYLAHKINEYTTFNDGQKAAIRKGVSDYMSWHRKEALPEYIIFLQNLNGTAQFDGELGAEKVALLRAQLLDLYKMTMMPMIRPTAKLLSELDGNQIQELAGTFAEQAKKQRKKTLEGSLDEVLDRRAEKTISFMEWLAGDLSSEQQTGIRNMSRQLPLASETYFDSREINQRGLIVLLNEHAGAEKIASFLSTWILKPEETRTSQQQHDLDSFEAATDGMIARIHGLLTQEQKAHIDKKISAYIEDMHGLMSDKQVASAASR